MREDSTNSYDDGGFASQIGEGSLPAAHVWPAAFMQSSLDHWSIGGNLDACVGYIRRTGSSEAQEDRVREVLVDFEAGRVEFAAPHLVQVHLLFSMALVGRLIQVSQSALQLDSTLPGRLKEDGFVNASPELAAATSLDAALIAARVHEIFRARDLSAGSVVGFSALTEGPDEWRWQADRPSSVFDACLTLLEEDAARVRKSRHPGL